jgi:hypothetical protein
MEIYNGLNPRKPDRIVNTIDELVAQFNTHTSLNLTIGYMVGLTKEQVLRYLFTEYAAKNDLPVYMYANQIHTTRLEIVKAGVKAKTEDILELMEKEPNNIFLMPKKPFDQGNVSTREFLINLPEIQKITFLFASEIYKVLYEVKNSYSAIVPYRLVTKPKNNHELQELIKMLIRDREYMPGIPDKFNSYVDVAECYLYVRNKLSEFDGLFIIPGKKKSIPYDRRVKANRKGREIITRLIQVNVQKKSLFPRRNKEVYEINPMFKSEGGAKKITKRPKKAAKKNETVHTGPRGGKFVVRNGKNVYV